jgi:hypothetical protein
MSHVKTEIKRTIDNVTEKDAKCSGTIIVGQQRWKTVCKAYNDNEQWFHSTQAMEIEGLGVLVKTMSREVSSGEIIIENDEGFIGGNMPDSSQSTCFISNACLEENSNGTVVIKRKFFMDIEIKGKDY